MTAVLEETVQNDRLLLMQIHTLILDEHKMKCHSYESICVVT